MGSLFCSPREKSPKSARKTDRVDDKDRAVLDLKNARDRLKKYRKKLDAESEKLVEQTKELIRKKQRDRALLLLKMKRHKENQVSNIDGQLIQVMEMIDNIEWEATNIEVMKALKAGNVALNKLHEEMSADDIAEILDETNEAIEVEKQINEMIAGQLTALDDEELMKELAVLMGDDESVPELPEQPSAPVLPAVPTKPIEQQQQQEQEAAGTEHVQMSENPILS